MKEGIICILEKKSDRWGRKKEEIKVDVGGMGGSLSAPSWPLDGKRLLIHAPI